MPTGGLIGTINALWGKYAQGDTLGKRAAYALGKAREAFSELSRDIFYSVWNRAEARSAGGRALAQLQNPNYRPGAASTVFTEFHVPSQYRYTYRITYVNPEGLEHTIHTSVYHDEKMTRGEAERFGQDYAVRLMVDPTSAKNIVPENYEYANSRWVLFEENTGEV